MKLVVASLLLSLLMTIPAIPARPQTGFEVASIRPSQPCSGPASSRFSFRGGRFEARAATVGDLLDMMVGFQLYRVTGGPSWMRTDRYDIVAEADHEIAPPDQYAAVMSLLVDRFKLRSHREKREVPGLVLRARRLPAGVTPAADHERYSIRPDGQGHFVFTATPLSALTNFLSQQTHVPVTDETDLKSAYDFVVATVDVQPQPGEDWGDRVREAVEALGFQAESRRVSLEITVVDGCERPTEN
jgi:uncharacterized protein (TIGR03435 family)